MMNVNDLQLQNIELRDYEAVGSTKFRTLKATLFYSPKAELPVGVVNFESHFLVAILKADRQYKAYVPYAAFHSLDDALAATNELLSLDAFKTFYQKIQDKFPDDYIDDPTKPGEGIDLQGQLLEQIWQCVRKHRCCTAFAQNTERALRALDDDGNVLPKPDNPFGGSNFTIVKFGEDGPKVVEGRNVHEVLSRLFGEGPKKPH